MGKVLALGRSDEALDLYRSIRHLDAPLPWALLDKLSKQVYKAGLSEGSLEVAEDIIRRYPQSCDDARLIAAAICIKTLSRPSTALKHLDALGKEGLKDARRAKADDLRRRAEAMIRDGIMEGSFE